MTTNTSGPIKSGRPRKDAATRVRFWDKDLYKVLLKGLPQHVEGEGVNARLNPRRVAVALKVHKYTVYNWLNKDKLSREGASLLIAESNGKLTAEDLIPFVLA